MPGADREGVGEICCSGLISGTGEAVIFELGSVLLSGLFSELGERGMYALSGDAVVGEEASW